MSSGSAEDLSRKNGFMKPLVLFDFDRTIISKDTGYEFLKFMMFSHPFRGLIGLAITPVALSLFLITTFKRTGYSILLWFASVGLDEEKVREMKSQFISFYLGNCGARIYENAIEIMEDHIKKNRKVVIVSGASDWMIEGILKRFGLNNFEIVASREGRFWGGLICSQHCYGKNKVAMLQQNSIYIPSEIWCYTDSASDIPILSFSNIRFLINPSRLTVLRCQQKLRSDFHIISWG